MQLLFVDRIQFFSILFSLVIFFFIFGLVKKRRVREEYSILWFIMSLFLLYLSLDRHAIDRLGDLFGVAYKPSVLSLFTTGFTFLVLIHITVILTKLSDQNKELIQELALANLARGSAEIGEKRGDILVIVPAHNEAASIAGVIADLVGIDLPLDILVVNDGSSDATSLVARATGQAMVIDLPHNLGIGGAVQTGFKYASRHNYRVAIQFDGDGQHRASEIPKLLRAISGHGANMVIGSRFLEKHTGFRSTHIRRIGIRMFMAINSLLIGRRITDNTSGFRAYDAQAIQFLARHYPVDYPEPESVILLGRNGFTIREEPAFMRERAQGDSSLSGIWGIYYMVKVLLAVFMTALRRKVG